MPFHFSNQLLLFCPTSPRGSRIRLFTKAERIFCPRVEAKWEEKYTHTPSYVTFYPLEEKFLKSSKPMAISITSVIYRSNFPFLSFRMYEGIFHTRFNFPLFVSVRRTHRVRILFTTLPPLLSRQHSQCINSHNSLVASASHFTSLTLLCATSAIHACNLVRFQKRLRYLVTDLRISRKNQFFKINNQPEGDIWHVCGIWAVNVSLFFAFYGVNFKKRRIMRRVGFFNTNFSSFQQKVNSGKNLGVRRNCLLPFWTT